MTKPKKNTQANPGGACGPKNPAPKRSHHKRKDITSGAPEKMDRPKNLALQKNGLPIHAYAIRPDEYDVSTWQLPHHTSSVLDDVEASVDWQLIKKATLLVSLRGDEGRRISADPVLIIEAARHIAEHYRKAGLQVPIDLCVLI